MHELPYSVHNSFRASRIEEGDAGQDRFHLAKEFFHLTLTRSWRHDSRGAGLRGATQLVQKEYNGLGKVEGPELQGGLDAGGVRAKRDLVTGQSRVFPTKDEAESTLGRQFLLQSGNLGDIQKIAPEPSWATRGSHRQGQVVDGGGQAGEKAGLAEEVVGCYGELSGLGVQMQARVDKTQVFAAEVGHGPAHHADIAGALRLYQDNADMGQ